MGDSLKRGDTGPDVTVTVGADLSGKTVTLNARRESGGPLIPLEFDMSVAGGETSLVHHPTGTLPVGTYLLEVKAVGPGEVRSVPSVGFGRLVVEPDLR